MSRLAIRRTETRHYSSSFFLLTLPSAWVQRASDTTPLPRTLPTLQEAARRQAEPDKAQLLSHCHYKAKDGHEVHSENHFREQLTLPTGLYTKLRLTDFILRT